MSTEKQQPIVRPNLISELLNSQFESYSSKRKEQLSQDIRNLFFKYDGEQYSTVYSKLKVARESRAELKKQNKHLVKLQSEIKEFTSTSASKITSWALTKNITIPSDVAPIDYKPYLLKFYEEKLNNNNAELAQAKSLVDACIEATSDCDKKLTAFNKQNKKQYNLWKTELLTVNTSEIKSLKAKLKDTPEDDENHPILSKEISKRLDTFSYLSSRLSESELTPLQREHYTLRIEKDSISSKMVRFACTSKYLSYYATEIVLDYTSNVFTRYIETTSATENLKNLNYKFPPISVEHVVPSTFVGCPIRDLYLGILVKQLSNPSPLSDDEKKNRVYLAIETHVRKIFKQNQITKTSKCDERVFALIYRTVLAFVKLSSDEISSRAKQDHIKTFQEKIIFDLFAYTFKVWGQEPYRLPKKATK